MCFFIRLTAWLKAKCMFSFVFRSRTFDGKVEAPRQLMKHGLETNYWNEYILLGYHHFQHDAIFLSGIPDAKESLPHTN